MTVAELIEELRKFPAHHDVTVVYPAGHLFYENSDAERALVDVYAGGRGRVVVDCTPNRS